MAPKKKQPARALPSSSRYPPIPPDYLARRLRKHLDELERSNYSDASASGASGTRAAAADDIDYTERDEDQDLGRGTRGVQGPSAGADDPAARRKRKGANQTANVRALLLYRKNLTTLLEEANLPPTTPNYHTATAPPPRAKPRTLCGVCGFWGAYACLRCAVPYCSIECGDTHVETCERRVG